MRDGGVGVGVWVGDKGGEGWRMDWGFAKNIQYLLIMALSLRKTLLVFNMTIIFLY